MTNCNQLPADLPIPQDDGATKGLLQGRPGAVCLG